MRISRDELLSVLESVRPGLSARGELEQSSAMVFQNGKITTFNGEVACRAPSPLNGITGAVHSTPLLAVLNKMNVEEVDVSLGDGEILIKGKGRRRSGVRTEADILLPTEGIDMPEEWLPLHPEFGEAIGMVAACSGKEAKQFATACVHVHPRWVEAYDNYQVIRYRFKTGMESPALVRGAALKHVATMGAHEFGETRGWLHYRNPSGLIISCRKYVEQFFDLSPAFTVEGEKISLPKGMADGMDAAESFVKEFGDQAEIMVELRGGGIRIKGVGVSGWYSEARDIEYDGPSFAFMIAPKLLKDITQKYNEAVVNENRIMIQGGGRWRYVAVLGLPRKEVKGEDHA